MCGIGGFSLSPDSTINPRRLSNALLTALEDRGYMASGYAWHTHDSQGVFKKDVAGSQLTLKHMSKKARTAVLHTRLATHGSTADNRNNHPVMSPGGGIALVHNGVIYNHHEVRFAIDHKLPDVDTSVIPALIEDAYLSRLTELDGDAAIGWLTSDDIGTLNVARLEHSPLVICQIEDGSFIFASTEQLLWRVLIQLDLQPEFMQTVDEYTYYRVRDGRILEVSALERPAHTSSYNYGYYRHQTAGAKGSAPSTAWSSYDDWNEDWDDDDQYWQDAWNTPSTYDAFDDDEDDEVTPIPETNSEYWIEYRSKSFHDKNHFIWYRPDESAAFQADVWLLRNDHETDYVLVDFGSVTAGGVLVSSLDK